MDIRGKRIRYHWQSRLVCTDDLDEEVSEEDLDHVTLVVVATFVFVVQLIL